MALIHLNIYSDCMKRNTDVNIILPEELQSERRRWPVLYLLHGTFGDYSDWIRKSNIERYAQERGLVVVMPSGDNGFYLDHYSGPDYASYIAQELYRYIPSRLPVTDDPSRTYIGGLSMGGYGAFYLAATHPGQYGAAFSLSGGFDIVKIMACSSFGPENYPFHAMFRDYTPRRWEEEDVHIGKLLARARREGRKPPRLFLAVGTEDITYEANQDLRALLDKEAIPYTYEEGPGEHNWEYWDREIVRALDWIGTGEDGDDNAENAADTDPAKRSELSRQGDAPGKAPFRTERSPEAERLYDRLQNSRVLHADFTERDTTVITKAESARIRSFSHLEDVKIRPYTADGVRLEEILVPGAAAGKVIYYIHGGGFVAGEPAWGYFYAVETARLSGRRMIAVDYVLAPEHPFPEGIEDCIRGYEWMLSEGIRPEDIVLLGESSGANLALALTAACRMRGIAMPSAICSVSPVVDVTFPFSSYTERCGRECILPENQAQDVKEHYLKNGGGEDPLASPIRADVSGFPPTYHIVSTEEMLFDDSIRMHEKLLKAGVDATLKVWEGMWHTFCMTDLPESRQVIRDIAKFFSRF